MIQEPRTKNQRKRANKRKKEQKKENQKPISSPRLRREFQNSGTFEIFSYLGFFIWFLDLGSWFFLL